MAPEYRVVTKTTRFRALEDLFLITRGHYMRHRGELHEPGRIGWSGVDIITRVARGGWLPCEPTVRPERARKSGADDTSTVDWEGLV